MSAPAGGYDFETKTSYRRWVWQFIGGEDSAGNIRTGNVLLMPSVEGLEISEEALKRGFLPSQLHVVDQNPAIVATLQRKFPGVNTYGCLVDHACQRIAEKGIKLMAANVDYCGQVSPKLLKSLKSVSESEPCKEALLFVNVLRGREDPYLSSIIKGYAGRDSDKARSYFLSKANNYWSNDSDVEPTDMDFWRVVALRNTVNRFWFQARAYVSSNNQSFLTVGFFPKSFDGPPLDPTTEFVIAQEQLLGMDSTERLPMRYFSETASEYIRRLTIPQRNRLRLVSYTLSISEASVVMRYVGESGNDKSDDEYSDRPKTD